MMYVINHNHKIHHSHDLAAYPHFASDEARYALRAFDYVLWTCHPLNNLWWPHLVDDTVVPLIARLSAGPNVANAEDVARGLTLGLLLEHDTWTSYRADFSRALSDARIGIRNHGYAVLPSLTFQGYDNTTIALYLERTRHQLSPDDQVPGRRSRHNDPLLSCIHRQLAYLVQSVANEPLKPSYCYLGVYPQGAELVKHTDRTQCRWNVSITYRRTSPSVWPIYVEVDSAPVRIDADIGQPVIYRGTDVPHWREPLPEGEVAACFYHFVHQAFTGSLT